MTLIAWNGSSWQAVSGGGGGGGGPITELQNLALLRVGISADVTNPFAAKLKNALWAAKSVAEGGDGNLRYKLSKESAAKTLSFLFQDNYSGRAEIGADRRRRFPLQGLARRQRLGGGHQDRPGERPGVVPGERRTAGNARRQSHYDVRTYGSDANDGRRTQRAAPS